MMNMLFFAQVVGAESVRETSLLVWYAQACGPFFGPVFLLISVVFVTLTIMNWLAISKNAIVPPEMIEQFHARLEAKEHQEAYEIAKDSDSSLGKVLAVGLVKMSDGFSVAEQAMNDAAEAEVMALEHRLSYLGMIASISPMVGLLGTVYGMILAFGVIGKTGAPQASALAGSISLALVTTQIGLMIAIPALVFFEVLKNRLARLVQEFDTHVKNAMKQF